MIASASILGNAIAFTFEVQGLPHHLRVLGLTGQEAISNLFQFELELACENGEIDLAEVLLKPASLTFEGEYQQRSIHGLVSEFEQIAENERYTLYRATLVPTVWPLNHRHGCKVFNGKKTETVVREVLEGAGIPGDQFEFVLKPNYEPRDYCVQYRESDWAFISRLLEEDGIFYYFDQTGDVDKLVFCDESARCVSIQQGLSGEILPFRSLEGAVASESHIRAFRMMRKVRPTRVTLRDYNFKHPSMSLECSSKPKGELEVYDYPGEYQQAGLSSPARGDAIAEIRNQEFGAQMLVGVGESDCERLTAGYRFTLAEHSRADYNMQYLLTSVRHYGRQPQVLDEEASEEEFKYSSQFSCLPVFIPFRPARVTPKPVVRGVQTAVVVGRDGEEIDTDEFGRVKVQFHWDQLGNKNEKSSCWVRVSQGWAGNGWGTMFIPRIGHEVIVDFIEGDPDRPIITGRVYNGENPVPYFLPEEATKSTIRSNSSKGGHGFNEFRFEDKKGGEQVFVHAERNMDVHVKHDSMENILNDRHQTIGSKGQEGKVGDQNEQIYRDKSLRVHRHHDEHVGGNMRLLIGGIDGDGDQDTIIRGVKKERVEKSSHLHIKAHHNHQVDGTLSLTLGNLQEKVGDKSAHEAGSEIHLRAPQVVIEAGSGITIKGPGGFITIDSGGVVIQGTLVRVNSGGSALHGAGAHPTAPEAANEATPKDPVIADRGHMLDH